MASSKRSCRKILSPSPFDLGKGFFSPAVDAAFASFSLPDFIRLKASTTFSPLPVVLAGFSKVSEPHRDCWLSDRKDLCGLH